MNKEFKRVTLDNVLKANTDGMPVFRKCFDHEILMSFYDDDGAYEFVIWWKTNGNKQFGQYLIDIDKEYLLED